MGIVRRVDSRVDPRHRVLMDLSVLGWRSHFVMEAGEHLLRRRRIKPDAILVRQCEFV